MQRTFRRVEQPADLPHFLNDVELANFLGVSVGLVRRWRLHAGEGPPFRKLGGCVRYSINDVHEWVSRQPLGGQAA